MSFELSNELKDLQARARQFTDEVLIPLEKDWPQYTQDVPRDMELELIKKGKEFGVLAVGRPKEFGGLGLGNLASVVVTSELHRSFVDFYFNSAAYSEPFPVLYECSDRIKEKYLWPIIKGEKVLSFAMTEPQSGSDFRGMRTTARKDGNNYVLDGVKIYPSFTQQAAYTIVWTILCDEKGAPLLDKKGRHLITTFAVDTDTPGFKITKMLDVLGITREPVVELKNCVVPAENMLGEPGEGVNVGMGRMNRARMGWATVALGHCERSLNLAINYAKTRRAFDRRIGEFQAIQWMLAESWVRIQAMRQYIYSVGWETDKNNDLEQPSGQVRTAGLKMYCLETGLDIVDKCMKIHGGIGMTTEFPFQRFHNTLKTGRAAEGTMEIMRYIVATGLLGRDITRLRPR
jgi:acyl-CoA dehydrogenase